MPLHLLDTESRDGWPEPYRHALVIVRSDTHVAWWGNVLPYNGEGLISRMRGAVVQAAESAPA